MVGELATTVHKEKDVASVERLWKERVEEQFPETEGDSPEDERRGQVPEVFKHMLNPRGNERSDAENMLLRKVTRIITMTKNATPGNASGTSVEAASSNSEPRCCILDSALGTQAPEEDARAVAIHAFETTETTQTATDNVVLENVEGVPRTKICNLSIQTGFGLQDQWQGAYLSKAMPFAIPRARSGPTFFPMKEDVGTGVSAESLRCLRLHSSAFSRRVENKWLLTL